MNKIPSDICNLADYERHAKALLAEPTWAYLSGFSMDGITHRRNRAKLDEVLLQQRILSADMGQGDCRLSLFGRELSMPLLIAPLAYQKLAHPMGELGAVQAAAAQGVGFCLSTLASSSIEQVAEVAPQANRWFQLYCQPNRDDTLKLIRRAEAAGYQALVVTADAPINGVRNAEQRAGFELPDGVRAVNLDGLPQAAAGDSVFACWMSQAPDWQTLAWIRKQTRLPLLLKGVMHPADAKRALEVGVDGVIVSNHGGRVLDSQPATIEVLPAIRAAVGPTLPVLLDSGIRRGSDIVKAIALGANAVLLGRPVFYAQAVAGPLGVAHSLRILRDELEATMALCGCATLADINQDCLYTPF
ncbi:alpha-hydroxy acid oxidase [Marinomonas ostreistagni]|uniref:alpha-hydroxy acid oxidase n=1 Tax=Marinomonas ostreistagni TaxID=359209 RepID=UPI00194FFF94|nr:alpha-hydroxy acid oxidase [Marinomonas ostreistagni]MBM6550956.1 alpha-hydroxy-acid oxidizing protein [Marinomonas ostreistagni]